MLSGAGLEEVRDSVVEAYNARARESDVSILVLGSRFRGRAADRVLLSLLVLIVLIESACAVAGSSDVWPRFLIAGTFVFAADAWRR
jgi:hypothetical protein